MSEYLDQYKAIYEGGSFLRKGKPTTLAEYAAFDGGGARVLIDKIREELDRRDRGVTILDWGCGTAVQWHTQCLADHSKSLMNILGPKVQGFYRYDPAYKMYSAKPASAFDFVICSDVLEHIPDAELPAFFFEINSYVHNNGVIFYSISTVKSHNAFEFGENMHVNIKSPNEWFDLLKKYSRTKIAVVFNGKPNY